MKAKRLGELVLQSLEHEIGGVEVYTAAISCALNNDLKEEWQRYLEETRTHVSSLETVCKALLPPPEERQHVKTAIGAARAEQAAEKRRH